MTWGEITGGAAVSAMYGSPTLTQPEWQEHAQWLRVLEHVQYHGFQNYQEDWGCFFTILILSKPFPSSQDGLEFSPW